jgi:hypothetical protein
VRWPTDRAPQERLTQEAAVCGHWLVCWLGSWDKQRISVVAMLVRFKD